MLAPVRTEHALRGRCGTKPGGLQRTEILIRTGSLEAESVAGGVAVVAVTPDVGKVCRSSSRASIVTTGASS